MNDYVRQIVVRQQLNDLRREAANERLARRARVRRDGTISFTHRIGVAVSTGLERLAAATGSLTSGRPSTANG